MPGAKILITCYLFDQEIVNIVILRSKFEYYMTGDMAEEMLTYIDTHCTLCSGVPGCFPIIANGFQDTIFG